MQVFPLEETAIVMESKFSLKWTSRSSRAEKVAGLKWSS